MISLSITILKNKGSTRKDHKALAYQPLLVNSAKFFISVDR